MGYVRSHLLPGETVLYEARLHWFLFVAPAFWLAVGLLGVAGGLALALTDTGRGKPLFFVAAGGAGLLSVVALFSLMRRLVLYATSEFGVTDKRVIAKKGFVMRSTLELVLAKVDSISVDQGILGRLFDYGRVTVAAGADRQVYSWVAGPLKLRNEVQAAQIVE